MPSSESSLEDHLEAYWIVDFLQRKEKTWADTGVEIASNNSGWAFGGGVPMGGVGLQNPRRQMGGNVSFAQSLSGSQSTAPLDLSYVCAPPEEFCVFPCP